MKRRFFLKVLWLLVIVISTKTAFVCHEYLSGSYKSKVLGKEVYTSLDKSRRRVDPVNVLILGDSVAKQLYDNEKLDDRNFSLACNYSISLVGQYILLDNFLKANQGQPFEVYLVYTPRSFVNNLRNRYAYQYFTKPFYREDFYRHISRLAHDNVRKNPFHVVAQLPYVKTGNWTPGGFHDQTEEDFTISIEYLRKLRDLCRANGVKFRVVAPFLSRDYDRNAIEALRTMVAVNGFAESFAGYFEGLVFLPPAEFRDGIHYRHPERFGADPLRLFSPGGDRLRAAVGGGRPVLTACPGDFSCIIPADRRSGTAAAYRRGETS